jgi:hypothetical protein
MADWLQKYHVSLELPGIFVEFIEKLLRQAQSNKTEDCLRLGLPAIPEARGCTVVGLQLSGGSRTVKLV